MKSLIASIAILGIVGMVVGAVVQGGQHEASVAATVTVQNISVSVGDGVVAYGALPVSTSEDTTSGGLNDTQIATNNGNVTEDLEIKGIDSANWTLVASIGVADEYVHKFCKVDTGDCDGTPTWTALTTSYQTLKTGVAALGTYDFDLEITTPSSSTNYTQQSVNVTVLATAS